MKSFTLLKSALASLLVVATSAVAQGPTRNSAEVAVGGGYAHLDTGREGIQGYTNHGVLDASASYNVLKFFSAGFEYTYTPLASQSVGTVSANAHLHNYGALLRFGVYDGKYVTPYISVAGGAMQLKFNATDGNTKLTESHNGGYLGAGVGANIYLGHHFGVRPEVRYERQQLKGTPENNDIFAGNGRNDVNLTGTLFYTFGGHR